MRKVTPVLLVLAAGILVPACEYVATAELITQGAVNRVCSQPPVERHFQRHKLAQWGLWAQCVPPGTIHDEYQLIRKDL